METSDTIAKLTKALLMARTAISHPVRNKKGHHNNRYADLTAVLDAVVPAFVLNGLALTQMVDDDNLVTMLSHDSGEFIRTSAKIPPHNNAQQLGSALTYLRRYTVQALAAIAAEDDDDGNAASSTNNNKGSGATSDSDW